MSRLVYLAGGIQQDPDTRALRDAYTVDGTPWRDVAAALLGPGFHPIDPKRKGGQLPWTTNEIVDLDLYDLKRSDLVLMELASSEHPYVGTLQELAYAKMFGKPVILVSDDPRYARHPWVAYHATKTFPSLLPAVEYIKERFSA